MANKSVYGLFLFLLFICVIRQGYLQAAESEIETNLGLDVEKDLGAGREVFINGLVKQRGFLESDYFRKIEAGGEYEVSERVSLRGSLKGLDLLGPNGWTRYYVPGIGGSLKWRPSRFEVDFRNIVEFWHLMGDGATEIRLKQRLKISSPRKLGSLRINPYLSEEYLTAINSNDHLVWNRVSGGNSFYLGKYITLETYYIWQKKNGSLEWKDAHVLGSKLKFSF
jgi:hypothetical protein